MKAAAGAVRRILFGVVPAICLFAALLAPAMADDFRVEAYKRAVETLVGRWAASEVALAAKIGPIRAKLAQKEQIQSPTEEDKARIAELRKQLDDIKAKMQAESDNLRLELSLVEVQEGAPKREMVSLPGWAKEIIKAKGLPIGQGVAIVPDADIDLKARKLKGVSIGISFEW